MSEHLPEQDSAGREGDWFDRELEQHELPSARDSFKRELREAFVGGEVESTKKLRESRENFRIELRERFVRGPVRRPSLPRRILQVSLPLAAAAVLLFLFLPPGIGDSRRWEVLEVVPDASILGAISDWQEIHTGNDRLRLSYGKDVFVEIGSRSRVERVGERDGERILASEGSMVFTSRPGEKPITLVLETPDAVIEVSSTSVAVDIYDGGTCVCVLEGNVTVSPRVGEHESVEIGPGCSCFANNKGQLHSADGVADSHITPIQEFKEFANL